MAKIKIQTKRSPKIVSVRSVPVRNPWAGSSIPSPPKHYTISSGIMAMDPFLIRGSARPRTHACGWQRQSAEQAGQGYNQSAQRKRPTDRPTTRPPSAQQTAHPKRRRVIMIIDRSGRFIDSFARVRRYYPAGALIRTRTQEDISQAIGRLTSKTSDIQLANLASGWMGIRRSRLLMTHIRLPIPRKMSDSLGRKRCSGTTEDLGSSRCPG